MTPRPLLTVSVLLVAPTLVVAAGFTGGTFDVPNVFQSGKPARASEVNENFASVSSHLIDIDERLCELEPANVVVVATEGGDFSSVAEALASITDSSAQNRYVVRVAPGEYDESTQAVVPPFVRLEGEGPDVTVVRAEIEAATSDSAAAVIVLDPTGSIADIAVENTGDAQISVGIHVVGATTETTLDNVRVRAAGSGGLGHFAVVSRDGDTRLTKCNLLASGASTSNAAFVSTDSAAAFSQPLLTDCVLRGEGPTSGFGMQITNTAADVNGCHVTGHFRSISATNNGITEVRDSRIESLGSSPVYEVTGSAAMLSGGVLFVGGTPLGLASNLKYAWCIKANYDPVVNGFGSSL